MDRSKEIIEFFCLYPKNIVMEALIPDKDKEDTLKGLKKIRSNLDDLWIPCEKGSMPEDFECNKGKEIIDVLVTTKYGNVTRLQRRKEKRFGKECWLWARLYGEMKAWRPLPEGYKG